MTKEVKSNRINDIKDKKNAFNDNENILNYIFSTTKRYTSSNYNNDEKTTTKMDQIYCNIYEEIACAGGYECIKKEFMCDGIYDCYDKSDESPDICSFQKINYYQENRGRFRPSTTRCPKTWFFCQDASKCIEPIAVCDGYNDCRDGSDESSFCYYLNVDRKKQNKI
uniref:Low-density lipoprotein receptor-related protein 2 n=1 Tax=Strongyloides stercoralis TaxID=6248 RepID=A0A0K0EGI0_STRER